MSQKSNSLAFVAETGWNLIIKLYSRIQCLLAFLCQIEFDCIKRYRSYRVSNMMPSDFLAFNSVRTEITQLCQNDEYI